jgi:hypothetical protein
MHTPSAVHQRKENFSRHFKVSEWDLPIELDIVALTGIETPYPALSDWAAQTFMECGKTQELQGEMYSTT